MTNAEGTDKLRKKPDETIKRIVDLINDLNPNELENKSKDDLISWVCYTWKIEFVRAINQWWREVKDDLPIVEK